MKFLRKLKVTADPRARRQQSNMRFSARDRWNFPKPPAVLALYQTKHSDAHFGGHCMNVPADPVASGPRPEEGGGDRGGHCLSQCASLYQSSALSGLALSSLYCFYSHTT